jgi:glyceraldehyde-3-phosphate dehydrogenase/erythrose-4-phosphate dehydrogenase
VPNGKIRVGIMGLGQIGRHLYHLARETDDIEIVAVADIGKPEIIQYLLSSDGVDDDIGKPEIIQYLLSSDGVDEPPCELQDNYLINESEGSRGQV